MASSDQLLADFANTFYGYGSHQAPYWFVGMEEGGGDSWKEVCLRLKAWSDRGRQELEDLGDYHRKLGRPRWLVQRPPLQSTWAKLIRLLLHAEGRLAKTEDVRLFQRDELGRSDGISTLIELLPLPSPSTKRWTYAEHSSLPQLSDRKAYREHYAEKRAKHIRDRIKQHSPRAVVFYGISYRGWWESIAGGQTFTTDSGGLLQTRQGQTQYLMMPHPTAMGVKNSEFQAAGDYLASRD